MIRLTPAISVRQYIVRASAMALLAIGLPGIAAAQSSIDQAPSGQGEAGSATVEHVLLPLPSGRTMDLSVYSPATAPIGVLFLSHGGQSSPRQSEAIIARLTAAGFVTLAPLHSDSSSLPEAQRLSLIAAFGERLADMAATAAYARQRYGGLPMGAVGYSYGSLFALMGGGAADYAAPARVPEFKAILTFSSPGTIPGLIQPDIAFARLEPPTMMVTGTADIVPGFVSNAADHLLSFDRAPAGKRYAIIVDGADHMFAGGQDGAFGAVLATGVDFLRAHMLDDAAALARLRATTIPGATLRQR
jgi:hypothetical protein